MPSLVLASDEKLRQKFGKKLLLLTPVYIIGFLFTAIPYYIGRVIAAKMVKDVCFTSTAKIVSGTILAPLFWVILLITALSYENSLVVYLGFMALVFCGAIFLKYHTSYRILKLSRRMRKSKDYTSLISSIKLVFDYNR